jgi:hypothetical protein
MCAGVLVHACAWVCVRNRGVTMHEGKRGRPGDVKAAGRLAL